MRWMRKILADLLVARREPNSDHERDPQPINKHLDKNTEYSMAVLADCSDFICRRLSIGSERRAGALYFVKGITDQKVIRDNIIHPLQREESPGRDVLQLAESIISGAETTAVDDLDQAISLTLQGHAVLLVEGATVGLAINVREYGQRAVDEPAAEKTITGPREGFIENINQNLAMVRKRLPTARFKSRLLKLGFVTKTPVAVCYIEGRVRPGLLNEVLERLEHLEQCALPEVLDTSYISQAIEDHPLSPFPQTMSTERADRMAANLLDGRVCVLVEGTPKALILPAGLPDQFQSPEDYYQRPLAATVSRWLRLLAAFLGTSASAIYVAVLTYHYEVIPQRLIVNVATTRAMVPFSPLFEAFVLEGAVELLREATNRLPSTVGQVIGVVGALVLGQAAVQASLVSPLLVITVAITTISSFAIPNNPAATALRLLRFPLIMAAGFL